MLEFAYAQRLINEIKALDYSDKALLADYLIITMAEEQDKCELSEEQKRFLEEDYKEYLADPEAGGMSWEEAKKEILRSSS